MFNIIVPFQLLLLIFSKFQIYNGENLEILLFHSNNIHYQFEETKEKTGGAARALHVLTKAREEANRQTGPPVLYLNAGDNFGNTYLYRVFGWQIGANFTNILKPDAMSLGNHDFDNGPINLSRLLQHIAVPIVGANIDVTDERILLGRIKPYHVFSIRNWTVGVIGYTTTRTQISSSVGNIKFNDEFESVKRECEKLHKMGVKIIIALGHAGYAVDKRIAKEIEHVDVVVGGHRKTWMENPNNPKRHIPEVYRRSDGKQIIIVHEYGYLKYLGMVKIIFDKNGNVVSFTGQPIFLHKKIPQDQAARDLINVDRVKRDMGQETLGLTRAVLSGQCLAKECNMANLFLDAFCDYKSDQYEGKYWTEYPIALINGGAFSKSINVSREQKVLKYSHIEEAILYDDYLCTMNLQGRYLELALEQGTDWQGTSTGSLLQVAGLHVMYNFSKEPGARLSRAFVRCGLCRIPSYKRLQRAKMYGIITTYYVYKGLDGHKAITRNAVNFKKSEKEIRGIVANYIRKYRTISPEMEDRLIITDNCMKVGFSNILLVLIVLRSAFCLLSLHKHRH